MKLAISMATKMMSGDTGLTFLASLSFLFIFCFLLEDLTVTKMKKRASRTMRKRVEVYYYVF